MEQKNVRSLTCPECGGDFSASDLLDGDSVATCLNCGRKYSTSEIFHQSTDEKVEEIRSRAYMDVEKDKIKAYKELECAKQKLEEERLKLERDKINNKNYARKQKVIESGFKKFISCILGLTITLFVSLALLENFRLISFNKNATKIGIDSKAVIGMNVNEVVELLEDNGFSNIEKKAAKWDSAVDVNAIIGIYINGETKFIKYTKFDKSVKIVITYNDAPIQVLLGIDKKDCIGLNYEGIQNYLVDRGFAYIEIKQEEWDYSKEVGEIKNIEIKGYEDFNKNTEVLQDAKITITINASPKQVNIGLSSSEIEGQNYEYIVDLLREKGFVYIEIKNENKWFSVKHAIKSITVNGKSDFTESDSFSQDSKIVIIYFTNNLIG